MSQPRSWRPYEDVARKWSDLAERRRAYYVGLYKSGRWTRYYTETEFILVMRQVVRDAERWAEIAGPPPALRQAAE
jgi:hypothetical protein